MPDADQLPISALLSRALVAFAIEFDNEFEHRMPHRTTRHGSSGNSSSPWLVSMAMWVNCMRFVPADGTRAVDLARSGRMTPRTAPMIIRRMGPWWGYLRIGPPQGGRGEQGKRGERGSRIVAPTTFGARAQDAWRPLTADIERRWRGRFGDAAIDDLRAALTPIVRNLPGDLPDFPTVGEHARVHQENRPENVENLDLSALISRVIIAYGDELREQIRWPLPFAANVLRVLGDDSKADGIAVRHLSKLTGIAKMGIDNSMSILDRHGLVAIESAGPRKARVAHLTPAGEQVRRAYLVGATELESDWAESFGASAIADLRAALEPVVGTADAIDPRLLDGIRPHEDGWRADLPPVAELPHYPMVTHRGGYPDGS